MEPIGKDRQLIPQPLRTEVKVQVELPAEARQLMRDVHDDRAGIAAGFTVLIVLLALAVLSLGIASLRYALDWRK